MFTARYYYARRSLERAVKWLYANDSYFKQPNADNLAALIHGLRLRSAPS
jgi:type I restriction enzyme, R subunit